MSAKRLNPEGSGREAVCQQGHRPQRGELGSPTSIEEGFESPGGRMLGPGGGEL